jgi:hypothetical protein
LASFPKLFAGMQAILRKYDYITARQLLLAEGATPLQFERAKLSKKTLFDVSEYIAALSG